MNETRQEREGTDSNMGEDMAGSYKFRSFCSKALLKVTGASKRS